MRLKELTASAFTLLAAATLLADCQGLPIDAIRGLPGSGGAPGGGGSGTGGTGGVSVEGCAMAAAIFTSHTCTTVCHKAAVAPLFGGFDMSTPGWEKRLVGAAVPDTINDTNKCKGTGRVYLNRTLPATGLFLDKLKPNPPCGVQMPMGLPTLTGSELDCVQRWANNLVAGGGNDGSDDGGSTGSGGSSGADVGTVEPFDAGDGPSEATPEATCGATGGRVTSTMCCNSASDFPDQCLVGACGCAPQDSHPVLTCVCQAGTCYLPGRGCVGSDCTIGQDQTCNDNPFISSYHGRCTPGPGGTRCVCTPPFTLNPNNGHCG